MKSLEIAIVLVTFALAIYAVWFLFPFLFVATTDVALRVVLPRAIIFVLGLIGVALFWFRIRYSIYLILVVWIFALLTGLDMWGAYGRQGLFVSIEALPSAVVIAFLVYYIVASGRRE